MNLSFIFDNSLNLAIGAGILSILYGIYLTFSILQKPQEKPRATAENQNVTANPCAPAQKSVSAHAILCDASASSGSRGSS